MSLIHGASFTNPLTLRQHRLLAQQRAIECRRCLVRCSSTGETCVIDAAGRIVDRLPLGPAGVLNVTVPLLEPLRHEEFTFERAWLRAEALRLADLRKATTGMKLNLPPSYLLIHRVTLGVMGVLCQLGSTAAFRAECEHWLPGFADGS